MIDEKKLIEDFKNTFSDSVLNQTFGLGKYTFLEVVKEMINRQPKVGEWIPCSERLPNAEKPYKSVLLQLKNSMVVGYINKAGQWFVDTGDGWCASLDEKPIAWMPLPEPYQKE